ncbi:MAG TPA: SRPBCC family protein [Chloroflexota bacterium]
MPDHSSVIGLAVGRFLEIVPNRRLKFTWGWEMPERRIPPGSPTVEIELLPHGTGTLLRLTHTGLPPDWVELHRQGWEKHIGMLEAVVAGI